VHRLVGHHATDAPLHPAEADHDVRREPGCTSRNSPSSSTWVMTWCMSYGWFGEVRDERVELTVGLIRPRWSSRVSAASSLGGSFQVVGGQVGQQLASEVRLQSCSPSPVVRDAGLDAVRLRPAELLEGHVLAGHRL